MDGNLASWGEHKDYRDLSLCFACFPCLAISWERPSSSDKGFNILRRTCFRSPNFHSHLKNQVEHRLETVSNLQSMQPTFSTPTSNSYRHDIMSLTSFPQSDHLLSTNFINLPNSSPTQHLQVFFSVTPWKFNMEPTAITHEKKGK